MIQCICVHSVHIIRCIKLFISIFAYFCHFHTLQTNQLLLYAERHIYVLFFLLHFAVFLLFFAVMNDTSYHYILPANTETNNYMHFLLHPITYLREIFSSWFLDPIFTYTNCAIKQMLSRFLFAGNVLLPLQRWSRSNALWSDQDQPRFWLSFDIKL